MSNRSGFGSGFWLGTLVGGVVGGIIGASIASQRGNQSNDEVDSGALSGTKGEKRQLKSNRTRFGGSEAIRVSDRMEVARRSLDDKINDLNNAIDAVRSSISHVPVDSITPSNDRSGTELTTPSSVSDNIA